MASAPTDGDPRDNPVWHALNGPLARFAVPPSHPTRCRVVRFDPEVEPFGAVERLGDDAWPAIAETVGRGGFMVLFRDRVDPPPIGWQEHYRGPCYQMQATRLADRPRFDFCELGASDAEQMLSLAQLTEPGPFFPRTHELGRFVGVKRDGRLVAMAGERFRVPGHVEVSAVCTHPDARGEGLGGMLTLEIAHGIRARGDQAFLHVLHGNENAVKLYPKLGFDVRRDIEVVVVQWHGDALSCDAPREPSGEASGDEPVLALPDPHPKRSAPST